MNLAYHNPGIYWDCACLSVNAGAVNDEDYENLIDQDIISAEIDEEDEKKSGKVSYDKIAMAIGKFGGRVEIVTPNINKAKMGFTPDSEDNTIMFGLKGLSLIGDGVVDAIIANRPYDSLENFVEKMVEMTDKGTTKKLIAKHKVVSLIKAGCFDALEGKPRHEIMEKYLGMLIPKKNNLTLANFQMLIAKGFVPEELKSESGIYLVTKEMRKHKDGNGFYTLGGEDSVLKRLYTQYIGSEPQFLENTYKAKMTVWDGFYEKSMGKVRSWITSNKADLIDKIHKVETEEIRSKYAIGDIYKWELDSLNFYHSGHPLTGRSVPDYDIVSIHDLKENNIKEFIEMRGNMIPIMNLSTIYGTVLVKDKHSGVVVLSTADGIIKVKIYKSQFAKYDKVEKDSYGKVTDASYFDKGTFLLLTGILRDDTFIPKVYKSTPIPPIVRVILDEENEFIRTETR